MNTLVRILEPVQAVLKWSVPASRPAVSAEDTANLDRLTRLIALANARAARVVGVTGEKSGVGTSATAHQLAAAYARFGKKVLLVGASGPEVPVSEGDAVEGANAGLLEHSTPLHTNVRYVELGARLQARNGTKGLRDLLRSAADEGHAVIVDLPPVLAGEQGSLAAFADRGGACDLVFLVCVSGEMTHKDLTRCVATCEVAGVKLGGLILNDWKLLAAGLLET